VPLANAGVSVPALSVKFDNVASADAARVTTTVYVLVVVPSCAVTTAVIVFVPTFRLIGPDAVPDVTVVPFTVTVALASEVVGVTVMLVVALLTLAV